MPEIYSTITEDPFAIREDIRLTDDQWDAIKDLFDCRRRRKHTIRGIIDAILFVYDNDIHWRMLPKHYAPWQTVYYYYDKWRKTGVWLRVLEVLPEELRAKMIASTQPSLYPTVEVSVIRPAPPPEKASIHTVDIRRDSAPPHRPSYTWILKDFLDEDPHVNHNKAA